MKREKIESDNMERFQYVSRAEDVAGEDSYAVKKDGKEPQSPKELIKEFCSYTSTHGVGRLAEAKTLFTRSIWTVFILGAFAMFIYQTSGLFKLYLRRPVSTAVKELYKTKVTFPAVTVCNENIMKFNNLASAARDAMINKSDTIVKREEENIDQKGIINNSTGGQNVTEDQYNDGLRSDYIYEELVRLYLTRHNYTSLSKMGHQYKDFVFDCNFRGKDCRNDYSKYWHQFWDFRYGNCFTFNGGMDDEYQKQTVLETRTSGSSGGLTLNLFIEFSEYFQFSHLSGARIAIHNQGKMPFPEDDGIDLVTGTSNSIGVRRKVFKRVDPFNNGSCRDAARYDDEDLYQKKFGSIYSRETCISSCLARVQIKNCGCAELKYPVDARLVCNKIDDPGKGTCLDDLYQNLNDDPDFVNCDLNCSVPCSDVLFETTVSSVLWPSGIYEGKLTNYVKARPLKPADKQQLNEQGSEFVKFNLLQVKVFFDQLNFQEVQEELSYKEVNLIADIGGQLGLWIGISVLTCCEVLELVLLLIQSLFKRVAANAGRVDSRQ